MYKTKSIDGTNNICGKRIAECRKNMPGKVSQRMFAEMLCVAGFEIDKNTFFSKGKNTPFHGYKAKGDVSTTIVSGRIVYEGGHIND